MTTSAVLPPSNGKKLWRVKRVNSNSSTPHINNSSECLNNSLRIAAAAAKFTIKRPPLRRPKNKPGKPKDFVFVDLSPIKSEEEEAKNVAKVKEAIKSEVKTEAGTSNFQLSSPTLSIDEQSSIFDSLNSIDTSSTTTSFEDSSSTPLEDVGLGIKNLGINFDQPQPINNHNQQVNPPQDFYSQLYGYQQAMYQQHIQIQQLQQQLIEQQRKNENAQSQLPTPQLQSPFQEPITSYQTAGQFRQHQMPYHQRSVSESCIKKPTKQNNRINHQRSMSIPTIPQQQAIPLGISESVSTDCSDVSLDDFMILNDQIQPTTTFTPILEYSATDDKQFFNYGIDEFLQQQINIPQVKNDEFEFNSYIQI
ncbi:unnamed protein product [Candida verbasci]|uniref:Uncharacterized protein n=1 Tax=Candida verbasci TaxID=1227364 RepID=A0A9W4TYX2_9ASCO|nr:unnamed protein product [Candida verbasci]